jgi:hypothetical protein
MSLSPADASARRLEAAAREAFAAAEEALAASTTADISDVAVQQLLTAGTRLFARKVEHEQRYFMPLTAPDVATPTDAAVMVTELLRTVNLNLFDLSMWAGRPRDGADGNDAIPGT